MYIQLKRLVTIATATVDDKTLEFVCFFKCAAERSKLPNGADAGQSDPYLQSCYTEHTQRISKYKRTIQKIACYLPVLGAHNKYGPLVVVTARQSLSIQAADLLWFILIYRLSLKNTSDFLRLWMRYTYIKSLFEQKISTCKPKEKQI